VGFVEDLQDVGKALKNGQKAWEAASNKLHTGSGNLVRQAEMLKELGAKASKAMPAETMERTSEGKEETKQGQIPAVGSDGA
jgi:DNA recombination protein RmuC